MAGDATVSDREAELLGDLERHAAGRRYLGQIDRDTGRQTVKRWLKRPGGPRRNLRVWREQRALLRGAPRGLSLAALPVSADSEPLAWQAHTRVTGVARPAAQIDPPRTVAWELALASAARVESAVSIAPTAWANYGHPIEIEIRVLAGGAVQSSWSADLRSDRWDDRRWVPWSLELPAGDVRLEIQTSAPSGQLERAWTLLAEPIITIPGRPEPVDPAPPTVPEGAPKISILMPVHDPPLALLEAALQSVYAQDDPGWQLCLTDDGSKDPEIQARLRRAAEEEPRVRLARNEQAQNISGATNVAFGLAEHPFVATMDHDDLLHPDAIRRMRAAIAADPEVDALYSDNDLTATSAYRFSASLKPDWSPDFMRSCMYTLHFSVYRRSLIEQIGGWRSEFDGAQDHDLVLRLSEHTSRVRHVPAVLYSWRAHPGSAALSEVAKPEAYDRGRNAVLGHVHRLGHVDADVRRVATGGYRVHYPQREPVTVVLLGGDDAQVSAWADAVGDAAALRCASAQDDVRAAALSATEDLDTDALLLVVEAGATPVVPDVITELAGHVEAGAAAAGGLLVDHDGRLLAGPVVFPDGLPITLHLDYPVDSEFVPPTLRLVSNRSAVRGAVALRRSTLAAGPAHAGRLGIAAATLAAADGGERVVMSPHARLVAGPEARAWFARHSLAELLAMDRGARHDPFYSALYRPGRAHEAYDEERLHGYEKTESVRNWLR